MSDAASDLDLAGRLDRHERPDGTDALHAALASVRPPAAAADAVTAGRLWARIDAEIGPVTTQRHAPDRPAVRASAPRGTRPATRWAVAVLTVVALGVGVWSLRPGSEVVATAEARIETYLAPDGSTITLRPNTRLVRLGERAYRVEGEAFFAVAPDATRPFTVDAGAGAVRVLGTRFDVSTWGGRTDVYVEKGRVEVRASVGEPVVLAAGEAASVDARGASVVDTGAAEALDWQRGEAVFRSAPARRVADEIGQHFGVSVTLPASIAETRVSGTVALDTAPDALADLGRILGGRFEANGGGYRFVAL